MGMLPFGNIRRKRQAAQSAVQDAAASQPPSAAGDALHHAPDRLTALLLPSVLCILLCMVCLCGMTFAWFSAASNTPASPVRSAEYTVSVRVADGETDAPVQGGHYVLTAGTEYTVTLTASGTATTGFCLLTLSFTEGTGSETLYTGQFVPGQTMTFTLRLTADATVDFSAQWGTSSRSTHPDISAGAVVER